MSTKSGIEVSSNLFSQYFGIESEDLQISELRNIRCQKYFVNVGLEFRVIAALVLGKLATVLEKDKRSDWSQDLECCPQFAIHVMPAQPDILSI